MHFEMLIAGHRVGGVCDYAIGKEVIRSPYDGSVVATVAEGAWSELSTAISAASDALRGFQELSHIQRGEMYSQIRSHLELHSEEIESLARQESQIELELNKQMIAELELKVDKPLFIIAPTGNQVGYLVSLVGAAILAGLPMVVIVGAASQATTMAIMLNIHELGAQVGVINCWNGSPILVKKALESQRIGAIVSLENDESALKLANVASYVPWVQIPMDFYK